MRTPKFDEIALLIYARMYQIHIRIILCGKYWSTHRVQTMENFETSDIILGYFGHLNFKDTVKHRISIDTIDLPPHLAAGYDLSFLTSRTKPMKNAQCADSENVEEPGDNVDNSCALEPSETVDNLGAHEPSKTVDDSTSAQDTSDNIGAQDTSENVGAQDTSENVGAQDTSENVGA